jgi:hypothetical protein
MNEQEEKFYEKICIKGKCYEYLMTSRTEVLNYYKEKSDGKGVPYIVFLSELIDSSRITRNYASKLLDMFKRIGQNEDDESDGLKKGELAMIQINYYPYSVVKPPRKSKTSIIFPNIDSKKN